MKELARDEYPNDIVHTNRSIEAKTGVKRIPDVSVEDVITGKVKKVYEAARTNADGNFVQRELDKLNEYNNAKIPSHFEKVQ